MTISRREALSDRSVRRKFVSYMAVLVVGVVLVLVAAESSRTWLAWIGFPLVFIGTNARTVLVDAQVALERERSRPHTGTAAESV